MDYRYSRSLDAMVREQVSLALESMFHLAPTDVATDKQGQDYHYQVNHCCPLAVRCRFDRPVDAPDVDVTFRHTEPAMILRGTYAPLALFLWFQSGVCVAGRLVDVYAMPSLLEREITWNVPPDKTGFVTVTFDELRAERALLRVGDGRHYGNEYLGALAALRRILNHWSKHATPAGGFF